MSNISGDLDPLAAAAPPAPTYNDAPALKQVVLLDPDGNAVSGPSNMLDVALQAGYKLATPENIAENAGKFKYGTGTLNTLKAAGAGFLRGATMNVSDPVMTHLGLAEPETLAGLEKYNPTASGLGQAAGVGAGLLVAPEAEGVAGAKAAFNVAQAGKDAAAIARASHALEGAKTALTVGDIINPVSAVSKLGRQAELAATGFLPTADAGMASKVLGVGAKGLGSAVEGAFYGLGQTATESALGDPDVNAERLMANVGFGSLLGGGLGGVVEAGRLAIPRSVAAAQNAVGKGWRTLWGDAKPMMDESEPLFEHVKPPEGIAPKVTGAAVTAEETPGRPGLIPSLVAKFNPEAAETLGARRPLGDILSNKERSEYQGQFIKAVQDTFNGTEKALSEAASKARPEEIETLLKDIPAAEAKAQYDRLGGILNSSIAQMKNEPALYSPYFVRRLEQIADHMEAGIHEASPTADFFKEINQAKQLVDAESSWGSRLQEMDPQTKSSTLMMRNIAGDMRRTLESETTWGAAGARQAAFNNAVKSFKDVSSKKSSFFKLFMKDENGQYKVNRNKVNQYLNTLHKPEGAEKTEALRQLFSSSRDVLDQATESFKNAPSQSFDQEAYNSLLKKNMDLAGEAHKAIASQPNMGYGGLQNLLGLGLAAHFGGPLGATLAMGKMVGHSALHPEVMAAKLANIERAAGKTAHLIDTGTRGIVNGISAASKVIKGPVIQDIESHNKRAEEITRFHGDPGKMIDHMTAMTEGMQQVAPSTAQSLGVSAMRANSFLASKLPNKVPMGMFEEPEGPGDVELAQFGRYSQAVDHPLSILNELKDGTMSKESLEAVQTVYPKLYQDMQLALMEHLSKVKDRTKIPYDVRLSLSEFMGSPLDPSLDPATMKLTHQVTQASADQEKPGIKPTAKGLRGVAIAGRTATPFQKTAGREA